LLRELDEWEAGCGCLGRKKLQRYIFFIHSATCFHRVILVDG